jgi:pSer/pThr/pTyr-binding forkhead associated (FHA) protein
VVFKDKVLQCVPLDREVLSIGRLKDNDIVIDNLAVSRHHARLHVDGEQVELEDLASGNGCLVNGLRVGRSLITPEDEVFIGKHQLVLRAAGAESDSGDGKGSDARRSSGSPWDGAHTVVVMPEDLKAALDAEAEATEASPEAQAELPSAELLEEPEAEAVVEEETVEAAEAPAEEPAGGGPYAGLIVQNGGRLDRVVPVEACPLVLGRAPECDLILGELGVSRRHAQLLRDGGRFEIEDLGSVNGTLVNGDPVQRRALEVGDEIEIDSYRITFVLEDRPLAEEIVVAEESPPDSEPAAARSGPLPLAETSPVARATTVVMGTGMQPEPEVEEIAEEQSPVEEAPDESRPGPSGTLEDLLLSAMDQVGAAAAQSGVMEVPVSSPGSLGAGVAAEPGASREPALPEQEPRTSPIRLEIAVEAGALPEALESALRAAGGSGLEIPVKLRLRASS